ncbi:MAG: hypothetical protein O7C75_09555, partial [Verrucomicrobia bacterium]|nr:hypothetical protein [Verrucomicrobiota bacterium]
MAVITPDTFNSLRSYVGVRLQQSVPLVDADWNEMEDIRKFEVRAFLKWFVGNGVPLDNDGFRIEGAELENDFIITSGVSGGPDGLNNVGRILVDGQDLFITADINFKAQALYVENAGAPELATGLGVPVIAAIPAGPGTALVYLDVWERLVRSDEDASLILPELGTESAVRIKRDWVVRVRLDTNVPAPGDPDYIASHTYYGLATFELRDEDPHLINVSDVTDLREKNLALPPSTLVEDLLGTSFAAYRRGEGRPIVSLRDALNAMLRGEIPASSEALLTEGPPSNEATAAFIQDAQQDLWAFFVSNRTGNRDIWLRRYISRTQSWLGDERITTDAADDTEPIALGDSIGDTWLFWNTDRGATNQNIWSKRHSQESGAWDDDSDLVTSSANDFQQQVFEDQNTNLWLFWTSFRENNRPSIWMKRYIRLTDDWEGDTQVIENSGPPSPDHNPQFPSIGLDSTGVVFMIYQTSLQDINTAGNDHIWWLRFDNDANPIGDPERITGKINREIQPHLLIDSRDTVWAFWRARLGRDRIQFSRFNRGTNKWASEVSLSNAFQNSHKPMATEDRGGDIWLFYRTVTPEGDMIFYRIFSIANDDWGTERIVTGTPGIYRLRAVL